jgi:NADPH-dependent ferric siderophore reductase
MTDAADRWDNRSVDQRPWDMWVDFARVYDGMTYGDLDDAQPGAVVEAGAYILVGDDDAEPAVARVVDVKPDGVVLLSVLPGHADLHRHLLQPHPNASAR